MVANVGTTARCRANTSYSSISWPRPLAAEALHGLSGEIVRALDPHTEADVAGVLTHLLVAVGNALGRSPYWSVGGVKHHPNLFCINVGATAARKGTAKAAAFFAAKQADLAWYSERVQSGLSSGEGLIWAVRDAIKEHQPIKEKGRVVDYQDVVVDQGIDDKRLLVVEAEFGSTLKMMERDGNVLSATLRQAWDGDDLRILTKSKAATATNVHVSLIGHITREELLKHLTETEQVNGFANRLLWVAVQRSKLLPSGGRLHDVDLAELIDRLQKAVQLAKTVTEMRMDPQAQELWQAVYEKLVGDHRIGLFGAATARAAPQTIRLALIYALLDCSAIIRTEHLSAALEVWRYCEDSARYLFGDRVGDRIADSLLGVIRSALGEGMTRTDLMAHFGRNLPADKIERGLAALATHSLIRREIDAATGGRPAERWIANRF